MKTRLAIAVGLLLFSVSVAQATPIRGTFTGVVTEVWNFDSNSPANFPPVGTPAWAVFYYDSTSLSPPDAFGNRWILDNTEYDGFFRGAIAGMGFWSGFNTGTREFQASGYLAIGPNGLPSFGGAASVPYDLEVFSNGFKFAEIDRSAYVRVEGTYSLPDHESVLPLTVIGLAALGLARRFL